MDEALPARDWLPRAAALLLGTLALAAAFIAAYVGALHQPRPRDVPVGVVLGDQRAQAVLAAVRQRTDKLKPIEYDDPDAAGDALTGREVYAVLTSGPDDGLRLATASAAAPAAAELVTQVLGQAARQANLPLALAVFAAAMIASAVQAWLGLLGTGLVILLLVVLGNPSSGGIYAPEFLPDWMRGMHRWNLPGPATDLIKSAVYFDRRSTGWPLSGLALWSLLGLLGLVTATIFRVHRRAAGARTGTTGAPTAHG